MSSLKSLKNEIKNDEQKIEKQMSKIEQPNETVLLAELLKSLRAQHEAGLLTICKQIKSIKIDDGIVEIDSDFDISELETNTSYHKKLKEFFNEFRLNFKLKPPEPVDGSEEVLNQMLGGKLTIK